MTLINSNDISVRVNGIEQKRTATVETRNGVQEIRAEYDWYVDWCNENSQELEEKITPMSFEEWFFNPRHDTPTIDMLTQLKFPVDPDQWTPNWNCWTGCTCCHTQLECSRLGNRKPAR